MNAILSSLLRKLFVPVLAFGFLAVAVSRSFAVSDDHINSSLGAAKDWIAQIDAGQYDESYDAGCVALHEKVKSDQWVLVLRTLRPPWGSVVSRKEISHVYKPDGFEGLDGECMVITYETAFQNLNDALEVVVLKWEDGRWRGAGYNVGPKPVPADQQQQPDPSQTETESQPHFTPPAQPLPQ
jgi:hypothetical protein